MSTIISNTKLFLARVLAWPQAGDETAYANVHNTFQPKDLSTLRTDKNGDFIWPWAGRACRSLDEMVKQVQYQTGANGSRDIYFCTSTQRHAIEKTNVKGYKFYAAQRNAESAVKLKSLFIDIDLKGGEHGYDTKQELVTALAQFLKDTSLPKPTIIISTGGGFHLYWCLMTPLGVEEWMPLAYALAEATKRHGLKCDSQVTIDAARVLRVPGTRNFKYDPPRPVTLEGKPVEYDYANERIEEVLEPYKVAVPYTVLSSQMSVLPPKTPIEEESDLSAGIDNSFMAPVILDTILPLCGFLDDAITNGGANYNNPLWNLTTLIATFTEGGRDDAHRMSSGHADYGPGETDELYDRKQLEKAKRNMGWPTCAAIAASGSSHCALCPKFAEHKSPLHFGEKVGQKPLPDAMGFSPAAQAQLAPAASPASSAQQAAAQALHNTPATLNTTTAPGTAQPDDDLPPRYLRNPNGVILEPATEDDGTTTWRPLIHYPMTKPWLSKDPWVLNFSTETEHGRVTQVALPMKVVGSSEMRQALQEQAFMIPGGPRGFQKMTEFIMAWITQLQSKKDSVVQSVPFGWMVRGGKVQGFVYGGVLHTPHGEDVADNTDPELQRQFSPTGDLHPWTDAARMITDQKRPALDAILATAFGAPLVRFSGHSGLLMSAYSPESGIGKSTAVRVAQSVWGDPVRGIQSLSDTQNSVLNKMGELRALPMYWDELQSDDDSKKFADTVFRLTLGKEKARLNAKVTQRSSGTWQTMLVAAANGSIMDAIAYKVRASTAGIYRVFEFAVEPARHDQPGQIDPTLAQRLLAKLNDNYGVVGFDYAGFLGSNHAQVESDVAAFLSNLGKEVNMGRDERFWVTLMGCSLLGARYANFLGYTQIDEKALKEFFIKTLNAMRAERNSQPVDITSVVNVVNILARFLNESRARNTIYTNVVHKGSGRPAVGAVTIKRPVDRIDAIHVHYGIDDKTLRIGQSYFYDWLAQQNYPRHVLLRAMQKQLGATMVTGRLGIGTIYANASEYLIDIDVSNTPLMDFINEV